VAEIFLDITKQNKQTTIIDRYPTTATVTLDQVATTPGVILAAERQHEQNQCGTIMNESKLILITS
jgi:hypothetical protein